jgi:hypothetical protein
MSGEKPTLTHDRSDAVVSSDRKIPRALVEDNTANAVGVLPKGKRSNVQPQAGELGSPAYSEMFVIEPKYES